MNNFELPTISQNYLDKNTVQPLLSAIEVKRPANGVFFRAHPDPAFSLSLLIFENQHTSPHVVLPNLEEPLSNLLKRKLLVTVITSHGDIKLMPVLQHYKDNWNKSAHRAIGLAKAEWVQMTSDRAKHTYTISSSVDIIPQPRWPDVTPEQVFNAAFENQYISDLAHPCVRNLIGKKA